MPRLNPDNPRARIAESSRRATLAAAAKATRRRALPRWALPSMKAAIVLLPLTAVGVTALWAWDTGRLEKGWNSARTEVLEATARSGLSVAEVFVYGRKETDRAEMLAVLGVERGMPILAFDPHAAREKLEQIPWVAAATVERRLPDTIHIRLTERAPMAVWQQDGKLHLVDDSGAVLTDLGIERFGHLPMLVGPGAATQGRDLLDLLTAEPLIGGRVQAAMLIGERRWDLKLDNGVTVRLPEKDVAEALRQLATVQQTNQVLERDVVAVDLRVPDRLVVQTTAEAAEARRKAAAEKKRKV